MQVFTVIKQRKGILTQQLRFCYLVITNKLMQGGYLQLMFHRMVPTVENWSDTDSLFTAVLHQLVDVAPSHTANDFRWQLIQYVSYCLKVYVTCTENNIFLPSSYEFLFKPEGFSDVCAVFSVLYYSVLCICNSILIQFLPTFRSSLKLIFWGVNSAIKHEHRQLWIITRNITSLELMCWAKCFNNLHSL